SDGIVTPVVGQPFIDEMPLGHALVYGHQLDRRDAQLFQVADDGRVRQRRISAPDLLRDTGETPGKTFHMRLIDDRVEIGHLWRTVIPPLEAVVDDDRLGRSRRIVAVIAYQVVLPERIAEQGVIPLSDVAEGAGIRIEHHLGWIEPVSIGRIVGTLDTVTV